MSKNKWFLWNNGATHFYTTYPKEEKEIHVPGDGSKMPTPKETHDKLVSLGVAENEDYIPTTFSSNTRTTIDFYYNGVLGVDKSDHSKTVELPCGTYNFSGETYSLPARLVPIDFRSDGYVPLDQITAELTSEVDNFLANEEVYRRLKTIYKFGVLLYGPPGDGKTSLLRNLVNNRFSKDSIVINVPASSKFLSLEFIKHIKKTVPDKLKIFIFEEVTSFVSGNADVEGFLSFMDGEQSIDNSIIFATTNYPEQLPANVVDRPSRFDKLYKVGSPNAVDRRKLLTHFMSRPPTEEEIKKTEKMSTAYIKEACLLTYKKGVTLLESIAIMDKQAKLAAKNFSEAKKLGIGISDDEY